MSMIDQPSPTCTCADGSGRCELPATRHCYVCGAALCEACARPGAYQGSYVTVCGCDQVLCLYALARRVAEERKVAR